MCKEKSNDRGCLGHQSAHWWIAGAFDGETENAIPDPTCTTGGGAVPAIGPILLSMTFFLESLKTTPISQSARSPRCTAANSMNLNTGIVVREGLEGVSDSDERVEVLVEQEAHNVRGVEAGNIRGCDLCSGADEDGLTEVRVWINVLASYLTGRGGQISYFAQAP